MAAHQWVLWIHLLAVATWTGGLITLAALIVALRKAGAERSLLQASARAFARLSWSAMGIAVVTGTALVHMTSLGWSNERLHLKLGLVATTIALAAGHQFTARKSSPAMRGMLQLAIMLASFAVFAAAVRLR